MPSSNFGEEVDDLSREEVEKERNCKQADIADFNDPVALQVSWDAKKYNSSRNGGIRLRLNPANPDIAYYKMQLTAAFFLVPFFGLGVGGIFLAKYVWQKDGGSVFGAIVCSILSLIFMMVPVLIVIFNIKPKVFDKSKGYYWRGFSSPKPGMINDTAVNLSDVHAVQILVNRNDNFLVYELNLVMHNADKVTFHLHGDRDGAEADGKLLAEFLNVPMWML